MVILELFDRILNVVNMVTLGDEKIGVNANTKFMSRNMKYM